MTTKTLRPDSGARRPYRRAARPNIVHLLSGTTPLPVGPRPEGSLP